MYKSIFLAASLILSLSPPVQAQAQGQAQAQAPAQGFTAGSGDAGSENEGTWGNYYGPTAKTGTGGTTGKLLSPSLTHLSSQTATGMPIPGTFIAPTNLALRNQGWLVLPETNLDSFVAQSGFNDGIYGDEGIDDIPPYFTFDESHRIVVGIESSNPGLTTGHRSNLPEAWGWPF